MGILRMKIPIRRMNLLMLLMFMTHKIIHITKSDEMDGLILI